MEININCDLGEKSKFHSIKNDPELLNIVNSANIACGYHAGDEQTMDMVIQISKKNGVSLGAHPSFNDPENFGRISQPISVLDLAELINEQIYTFENIATPMGAHIHHVKLHGALYNDCAKDPALSKIFVQTIQAIYPEAYIYGLSESNTIQQAIILGQPYMQEVFADRTYQKDGTLTPRHIQGALIEDIGVASKQALSLVMHKKVHTLQDEIIKLPVDTICIHGDGFHAVDMAKAIYTKLKEQNIEIKYPQ